MDDKNIVSFHRKSLKIGEHHTNHCEDFLIQAEIGEHRHLLAIMDGCTMGIESHFASTLIGKLLRKISKNEYFREYGTRQIIPLQHLLDQVLIQLHQELKAIQTALQLTKYELLSTLVISVVDAQSRRAEW